MSLQSNTPSGSDASGDEQTVLKRPSSSATISAEPGMETYMLYWALTDLKEKFHELATDRLAERNLDTYVEYIGYIEMVDELLENLFLSLNNRFEEWLHFKAGIDHKQVAQSEFAAKKEEVETLRKRFGWDK